MKPHTLTSLLLVASIAFLSTGCLIQSSSSSSTGTGTGTGTGAGGTFTGSDLNGTWSAPCTAFSGMHGETYYQNVLTISSGTVWSLAQYAYSSSACSGAVYMVYWATAGTFTVGGITSGSMQSLQFTITTARLMPLNAGMVTWLNANTSGFPTAGAMSNGRADDVFTSGATINGVTTPLPVAAYDTVNNVGTLSGTTLTLGAGVEAIPGVYLNSTVPTSVTVAYTKQ